MGEFFLQSGETEESAGHVKAGSEEVGDVQTVLMLGLPLPTFFHTP